MVEPSRRWIRDDFHYYVVVQGYKPAPELVVGCKTRAEAEEVIAKTKADPRYHDSVFSLQLFTRTRGPLASSRFLRRLWWVWDPRLGWTWNDSQTALFDERARE